MRHTDDSEAIGPETPVDGAESTLRFARAGAEERSGGGVLEDGEAAPTDSDPQPPETLPPSGGGETEPPERRPVTAPPRRKRWGRRIVAVVFLGVMLIPVLTWGWVWYTARQDARPVSDAIVVLGASQYNGDPSPVFEARLQHAADLYRDGVADTVITVGGNQPGDNYTEGGSGRKWLRERGIPAEDLIGIGEGSNTLRSIDAVSQVFSEQGWTSAVLVTDPWHSLRTRTMARDAGIEAAASPVRSGPAVEERETQLWYITRETASIWYYWLFGDSSDVDVSMPT
ncbi:vancomycin permeability regulator SanA [Haloactinospora alba]|uniref:Vancomycin permeability regulator SanA n=1 Tax=Haloactinospora alba TaxID=405555 RepID=A0A543NGX0_9ACTN|nr:vancomycin permeability regulator SanA [Haloactinospora alba]